MIATLREISKNVNYVNTLNKIKSYRLFLSFTDSDGSVFARLT